MKSLRESLFDRDLATKEIPWDPEVYPIFNDYKYISPDDLYSYDHMDLLKKLYKCSKIIKDTNTENPYFGILKIISKLPIKKGMSLKEVEDIIEKSLVKYRRSGISDYRYVVNVYFVNSYGGTVETFRKKFGAPANPYFEIYLGSEIQFKFENK